MGQFILFLLGLFSIGCVLYGISAGVQVIQRGFACLTKDTHDGTSNKRPLVTPLPPITAKTGDAPAAQQESTRPGEKASSPPAEASPIQRSIGELRGIFALYQQGGLTEAEFESLKHCLLDRLKTAEFKDH